MTRKIVLFLASFMGVGYIKVAPGSFGSLAGLLVFEIINAGYSSCYKGLLLSSLLVCFAFLVVSLARPYFPPSEKDPPQIVIDEAAAMWLVLSFLPLNTWVVKSAAFGLFRFFDVLKPLGIKRVEKIPQYALGIILDDILAALYAIVTLNLIAGVVHLIIARRMVF